MVHEHAELAAPLVGAMLGVPSVTHSFGGGIPAAFVAEAGDRLAGLWAGHGMQIPPYAGAFTSTYLDICPPVVQTQSLEHILWQQPLRAVGYTGEPVGALPGCLHESDSRPLVYFTLGTVQNRAHVLAAAVRGLADVGARILVTVGPNGHPEALGPQPDHVSVERWVCQSEVLPHCAAVVSHAGSGTFLGTLSHGLPQLCLPQAGDQFRNGAAAVSSGAGITLHPDTATPATIAAAVRQILVEDSFRDAALAIAAQIRTMPAPAEVATRLERLP